MKRRCVIELAGLILAASLPLPAQTIDLSELFDELESPAIIREVAEMTGIDSTELRQAIGELHQALAEDLKYRLEPPPLELPVPPSKVEPPLWTRPEQRDWPVGAQLYVRQLKPIFVAAGVPAELVWVAEVESRFEPWARSRTGAAGLFQLMPDTAELLGLSLKPADERYLPVKSAQAAARYLKYLYDKFRDWRLTLAAYNAGEGRVRRLLDQYRKRSFDDIVGRLPLETQLYVPKVEATILRREGVALADLQMNNP